MLIVITALHEHITQHAYRVTVIKQTKLERGRKIINPLVSLEDYIEKTLFILLFWGQPRGHFAIQCMREPTQLTVFTL